MTTKQSWMPLDIGRVIVQRPRTARRLRALRAELRRARASDDEHKAEVARLAENEAAAAKLRTDMEHLLYAACEAGGIDSWGFLPDRMAELKAEVARLAEALDREVSEWRRDAKNLERAYEREREKVRSLGVIKERLSQRLAALSCKVCGKDAGLCDDACSDCHAAYARGAEERADAHSDVIAALTQRVAELERVGTALAERCCGSPTCEQRKAWRALVAPAPSAEAPR